MPFAGFGYKLSRRADPRFLARLRVDPARAVRLPQDDYAPSGWRGPGVEKRAVPGHPFGLDLSPDEKSALIAFLRTL